jgi:hypothetical protein
MAVAVGDDVDNAADDDEDGDFLPLLLLLLLLAFFLSWKRLVNQEDLFSCL